MFDEQIGFVIGPWWNGAASAIGTGVVTVNLLANAQYNVKRRNGATMLFTTPVAGQAFNINSVVG